MNKHTDVVIIGGGVIGCATAYFLRKAQVEVTVLERGTIGGQASGAAAGLLAPLGPLSGPGPFADLVLAGFAMFPSLVMELEALSGVQVGFTRPGALRVVRNPKRVVHLRKRLERWQPLGLQLSWLTGEEARRLEPHLAEDICAAIYAPEEAQLDAPRLVQAFAQAAQRLGAHLYPHQEVKELVTTPTKVVGVRMRSGETLACEHVVLATGAWTATWNEQLQVTIPISPLHGQLITVPQGRSPVRQIVFGEAIYLAPRGDSILVGATKEDRGFEVQVTEEGTIWLHTTATRLVPTIATAPLENAWAGLRPKTADSHPILTRLPAWENVIVAAGHTSVGMILSGITGQGITHLLTTGQVPELFRAFSLDRFC